MENVLPPEIILDIISRLPFDSVLECRRVSKTWRILTYNPSFARLHLLRSRSLQFYNDNGDADDADSKCFHNHSWATPAAASKVGFVSLIRSFEHKRSQFYYGEYKDDDLWFDILTKINHPLIRSTSEFVVSCNGLICLTELHNGIKDPVYICNPITREYINLPRFTTETLSKDSYIASGFGYHPKINEYKVVRIYYHDLDTVGQVQVYTLGSGTGWRNKEEIKYKCKFAAVLAHGALHWRDYEQGTIVSFDLADEEFHLLPFPPCSKNYYQLKVLGGLLCVVHQKKGECVKIWSLKKKEMLKEQTYQSWTWSLEFNIEWEGIFRTDFMHIFQPFGLTNSGEVLLWYLGKYLYRYNLKTKFLEALVEFAPSKGFYAIPHINSFVSLKALGENAKIIESAEVVMEPQNN